MVRVIFKFVLVSFIFCFAPRCEAKVKLPVLVSDGMVLQRNQKITIWGWADPAERITIEFISTYETTADDSGNWNITLPPLPAGGPHTLTINDLRINDVLIGDVWLCSGQSNMELPISRVTDLYAEEVNAYANPQIRYVKTPLSYNFHSPQNDIKPVSWKALVPEHVMGYSALAYFFAKEWHARHNVPVGIINSSAGGSPVEAWISEEGLKPFPKYLHERDIYTSDDYIANIRKTESQRRSLWNSILCQSDAGLNSPVKWFDPQFNDTGWQEADLFDTFWSNNGLNPVNGSFWFRKEFDVPANLLSEDATLRLGCIVDADSVYVNGTFVGTTAYQYPPRIYKIPAGVLKAGKNQVTIRLISYGDRPHFVREKPYKIVFANRKEISLEGKWKHQTGSEMPVLPGETFFQYIPTGLYNSMIAPVTNYTVRGAIWCQGESNTSRHNEYAALLSALINDWRSKRNQPGLPFVITELAGFGDPADEAMQTEWTSLRAAQRKVAGETPYTGLAKALDLGEWNDIHPLNKKDLGIRIVNEMERLLKDN